MISDYKIPIIVGRNDIPTSSESEENHPNGSFITKKFNDLIDNELILLKTSVNNLTDDLEEVIADMPTTASIRQSISVTGNATYNNATGVITVNAVDHISLTATVDRTKTYTAWGDLAETINLGTFTVTDGTNGLDGVDGTNGIDGQDGVDGTNGQDGRSIEKVTTIDNGDGTKTLTFWGDTAETINLGNLTLASGVDGVDGTNGIDGQDGVDGTNGQDGRSIDHISLTATNGLIKTYTAWGDVAKTINLGTFNVTDGTNGTNGINGINGVSPSVIVLTQSAYNALGTPNPNTFYVING